MTLHVPAAIGDYTDFYASIFHATNVGSMLRPDEPLLPNYKYVPIGYHGRASSVVASGTPVRRPCGQVKPESAVEPVFGPSRRLDYELEVGDSDRHRQRARRARSRSAKPSARLRALPAERLVRARHPAVGVPAARAVPRQELRDDRSRRGSSRSRHSSPSGSRPAPARRAIPRPLPYLSARRAGLAGAIRRAAWRCRSPPATMRAAGHAPVVVSRSNLRHLYWTLAQLVTHHTSNGCNLRPGDLLGTGTVSGPTRDSRGCLLELTWRGTEPIQLRRRDAPLSRGRRRSDLPRLVRARGSGPHRLRRVPRHGRSVGRADPSDTADLGDRRVTSSAAVTSRRLPASSS